MPSSRFVASALSVLALAALGVAAAAGPASAVAGPPAYYPSGPQLNVDKSALEGWTLCYSGSFGDRVPLYGEGGILSELCTGEYLLLAGGAVDSSELMLLAAAPRADALFDTGRNGDITHIANGAGWYFSNFLSWGFALSGDPVSKDSCDVEDVNPDYRLCFHVEEPSVVVNEINQPALADEAAGESEVMAAADAVSNAFLEGGYRIGATDDLNDSTEYARYIYQAASRDIPVTTPAVVPTLPDAGADAFVPLGLAGGLLVVGIMAFGFVRRRAAQ